MSAPAGLVGIDHLSPGFAALKEEFAGVPARADAPAPAPASDLPLAAAVDQLEREMIRSTLDRTAGNISETARVLGLTRRGLYLKMRRLGLEGRPVYE